MGSQLQTKGTLPLKSRECPHYTNVSGGMNPDQQTNKRKAKLFLISWYYFYRKFKR